MGLLIVCYAAGLLLGSLSLIEWLVSRIARLWLGGFLAGLVVCLASAIFAPFAKRRSGVR